MLLGARSDPGAVHRAREGREFRVLGSKMRRPADSEFPGGNRDREAGNPLNAFIRDFNTNSLPTSNS